MPDELDAMLLRLRAQHSEPVRRTWTSGLEARLNEKERDDDELHTKTIKYGCADGAGGNERDGGSSGGQRCLGGPSTGTEAHAVGQGANDARAGDVELPQQRTRSASLAAEAPPPVPGHLADGQRPSEVDPYSPDPSLYPPEWLAEFDRRCKAAVAEMTAAIERAGDGR